VERRVGANGKDALLVLLALVAYVPVLWAGFVWDDTFLIVDNPNMQGWAGLVRTWTEPTSLRYPWYPLTYTSFWLEYAWVGARPLVYHIDNVLLHAADAVLLFRLAAALGVPGAWLAGALFAVHPIHVESVAWITERKNVLAGLFALLSLHAFVRATDLRGALARTADAARDWHNGWLCASLAGFALAMLSKTAVAPLPGALLVLLWLAQGRISVRDAARVAPFFAVAIALGAITMSMETNVVGEGQDFIQLSLLERTLLYPRALWFYAGKHVFPADLMFFYPRWEVDARDPTQWLPLVGAAGALAAGVALIPRWGRGPLAAILIYGGMLVPASGFFNVLFMFYSFVQNHFAYFASMPLVVLLAAAVPLLCDRVRLPARARIAVAALVLAPLAALTGSESRTFENEEVLWRASVERNPRSWTALTNLGGLLVDKGDYASAEGFLRRAIEVNPVDYWAHNNLGIAMLRQGRNEAAIPSFEAAIREWPGNPVAWTNLGLAFARLGRGPAAVRAWQRAIASDPSYAAAHEALRLWQQGEVP
jgi:hypothetical protein